MRCVSHAPGRARHGEKMRLNAQQDPGKQHSKLRAEAEYREHLAAAIFALELRCDMSATCSTGMVNVRTNNSAVRPAVYVGRSGRLDCSFDVAPRNTATRRSSSQSSTSCSPCICSARRLAACSSMQSSFAAQITCRLLSTTSTLYRMMQSHPKGGPSPYSNVRVRPRQTSMNARGTFVRVAIRLY